MKILDDELREYRSEIGKEKFKKIQINYCIKSKKTGLCMRYTYPL